MNNIDLKLIKKYIDVKAANGKSAYEVAVDNGFSGTETEWLASLTPDISGKENISNKVTSLSASSTDTQYPSAKLLYDQLALKADVNAIAANDAMIFKGTIGASADSPTVTALPDTHSIGWSYKVITAGTYAGNVCEIGDLIICVANGTAASNNDWLVVQTNLDGTMTGPASAIGGNIPSFNGTSGKILQDSGVAAGNVNVVDTTPSLATSYYLTYTSSRDNNQTLRANTDLYYYDTGGASYFNIGSSTNMGGLTLHQNNSKYINIIPKTGVTANRTLYLPDEDGTLATVEYADKKRKVYTTTSVRASYAGASGEAPRYLPGKWSISAGIAPVEGNVYVIKVPSAGTTAGQYLSVSGTTDENYHPIVLRGASRMTTQFEVGAYVEVIYEENKTVTVYELNATAQNNETVSYTGGVFRVLNYYDANTNTLLRTYALTKDAEFPLIGASTATSGTPDTHTSSYKDSYGMIPSAAVNKATINLSTGKVTIPSGLILGTSSSKLGNIVFKNSTNAYTTTINSGTPTANRTLTLPNENGTLATVEYVQTAIATAITNAIGGSY